MKGKQGSAAASHIPWAFRLDDAPQLPLTGESHPLRRELARWLSWANGITLLLGVLAFAGWWLWSHRQVAVEPPREIRIVRYTDLGVPPSISRPTAPQVSVAQAVADIVAPPPSIAVPEPVADELASAQTIASVDEMAEALAPVSLDDLNLAAGDSVAGGYAPAEAEPQEIVFESTQVDEAPEVVTKTPPVYPRAAREQGIEGFVAVKLLVTADGAVRQVNILRSKPEGVFDEAVGQTVAGWVFKPGRIGGKPVPTWVTTTLQFRLN